MDNITSPQLSTAVSDYYRIILRLAASPLLRYKVPLLILLVREIRALLRTYGVMGIYSSEPRLYRDSPNADKLLAEALSFQCINQIDMVSETTVCGQAHVSINLGSVSPIERATSITIIVHPVNELLLFDVAAAFSAFINRWFEKLGAASAFVDVSFDPNQQVFQAIKLLRHNYGVLSEWADVRRFITGVFWGQALGHDLCKRLGGQHKVMHEAPFAVSAELGQGVWLQFPPVKFNHEQVESISAYFLPLISWTKDDVNNSQHVVQSMRLISYKAQRRQRIPLSFPKAQVPLHLLDHGLDELDTAINIYFDTSLSKDQSAKVGAEIDRWYNDGTRRHFATDSNSMFGLFHSLEGPAINGTVWRYSLDRGPDVDALKAFDVLCKRLAALPNIAISKVVIGLEVVE